MELAAWILVLTKPVRSNYATDSKNMMDKALYLIQQAKVIEDKRSRGEKLNSACPYKKAWGLQVDGDLWEIAWKAILQRGSLNQKIRKLKGHATEEDVKEGRSTKKDQEGNDKADRNADKGVEMVHGKGLVRLAEWLAEKHNRYVHFMGRIQKVIAAVTLAEKEARKNASECEKAVLGYDPAKWQRTDAAIRNHNEQEYDFGKLRMPPPVLGLHRYTHCKGQYSDVHRFMANRRWAPICDHSNISGVTWLELFILFDIN